MSHRERADITQDWLLKNVGEPTYSWGVTFGSKYSEIYQKTGNFETELAKYNTSNSQANLQYIVELLFNIVGVIDSFSHSSHSGATSEIQRQKKSNQQLALNVFRSDLVDKYKELKDKLENKFTPTPIDRDVEMIKLRSVIANMKTSPTAIIRNSGLLAENCRLQLVKTPGLWGAMVSENILQINERLPENKSLLIGTIVHEMHHFLCKNPGGNGYKYIDEFVAHYKEFNLTLPPTTVNNRIAEINENLEKNYANAYKQWTDMYRPFSRIEQAGDFLVPDNAERKNKDSNNHGGVRI